MPYSLKKTASLEWLIDYVVGVEGGLAADEAMEHLAPPWAGLLTDLRKQRDARDEGRWATARASARVRVVDARWDEAVLDLSGCAFQAAKKNAKASPYQPLFGTVTAAEARDLGPHKAAAVGKQLVVKARHLEHAEVAASAEKLAPLNTKLEQAVEVRDTLSTEESVHEISRQRAITKVERQIALTEVALLSIFLGNKALVQAVLSPTPEAKGGKLPVATPVEAAVAAEEEDIVITDAA